MPRRRKHGKGKRPQGLSKMLSDQNKITKVVGRAFGQGPTSVSTSTTIAEFSLTVANLGSRIVAIADTFQYWRMVKLRVRQVLTVLSTLTFHAVAFTPIANADFTIATTLPQMVDFPEFAMGGPLCNNYISISVGRAGLIGSLPTKWLETNANEAAVFQSVGTISSAIIAQGTDVGSKTNLLIEFELEFRGPIDTALNPLSGMSVIFPKDYVAEFKEDKKEEKKYKK